MMAVGSWLDGWMAGWLDAQEWNGMDQSVFVADLSRSSSLVLL
jgi:hypothetical protein